MAHIILLDSTLLGSNNDNETEPTNRISDYEFTDYIILVFSDTQKSICEICFLINKIYRVPSPSQSLSRIQCFLKRNGVIPFCYKEEC